MICYIASFLITFYFARTKIQFGLRLCEVDLICTEYQDFSYARGVKGTNKTLWYLYYLSYHSIFLVIIFRLWLGSFVISQLTGFATFVNQNGDWFLLVKTTRLEQ